MPTFNSKARRQQAQKVEEQQGCVKIFPRVSVKDAKMAAVEKYANKIIIIETSNTADNIGLETMEGNC